MPLAQKRYLGSTPIVKRYRGSTLVWSLTEIVGFSENVSGLLQYGGTDGEYTLDITSPTDYAVTDFVFNTSEFDDGPIFVVHPDISGNVTDGTTLNGADALYLHDISDGSFSLSYRWETRATGSADPWVDTGVSSKGYLVSFPSDEGQEFRRIPIGTSPSGNTEGTASNVLASVSGGDWSISGNILFNIPSANPSGPIVVTDNEATNI